VLLVYAILAMLAWIAFASLVPLAILNWITGKMKMDSEDRVISGSGRTRRSFIFVTVGHFFLHVIAFVAFTILVAWLGYMQFSEGRSDFANLEDGRWHDVLKRSGFSIIVLIGMVPLHGFIIFLSFKMINAAPEESD
jgi:hypothetical protein